MSGLFVAVLLGLGVMIVGSVVVAVRPYNGRPRRKFGPKGFLSVWQTFRPKRTAKRPG